MAAKLLKVEEVAERTGWKEATVRSKILRREIPYVKLGRSVRISEDVLNALIVSNTVPARAEAK